MCCLKKSIVNAFSNISKEYVRSFYFPIYKIHSSDTTIPVKWVLNVDKKKYWKKSKVCYYNNNLERKSNFDKTLFKKDVQNEEEGL
jgi:hypothetical protein